MAVAYLHNKLLGIWVVIDLMVIFFIFITGWAACFNIS